MWHLVPYQSHLKCQPRPVWHCLFSSNQRLPEMKADSQKKSPFLPEMLGFLCDLSGSRFYWGWKSGRSHWGWWFRDLPLAFLYSCAPIGWLCCTWGHWDSPGLGTVLSPSLSAWLHPPVDASWLPNITTSCFQKQSVEVRRRRIPLGRQLVGWLGGFLYSCPSQGPTGGAPPLSHPLWFQECPSIPLPTTTGCATLCPGIKDGGFVFGLRLRKNQTISWFAWNIKELQSSHLGANTNFALS